MYQNSRNIQFLKPLIQMKTQHTPTFNFGQDYLTIGKALLLARNEIKGKISAKTAQKVEASYKVVQKIVKNNKVVYGINTGFGPLCTSLINQDETRKLQYNLLMSHSVGVGNCIQPELAKLMLILKLHALCQGYSGISPSTAERILWHIDNDIIPCVPEQGSVGASGDLAPLSHLFLPLIGMGYVW